MAGSGRESQVGAWARLEAVVGLISDGGATVNSFKLIRMGHAGRYQEEQPELAVWHLLFVLSSCIWGFQQYLQGSNQCAFLCVNLSGS